MKITNTLIAIIILTTSVLLGNDSPPEKIGGLVQKGEDKGIKYEWRGLKASVQETKAKLIKYYSNVEKESDSIVIMTSPSNEVVVVVGKSWMYLEAWKKHDYTSGVVYYSGDQSKIDAQKEKWAIYIPKKKK